ncbi:integrase arm-type DNA-binding domain-containing protein [Rhizobiaceae bacterium BDR2-2]|uniref:Integrase arm-type DNA-binding domain-containing protein n=1 Tax=Ectorhizobium quercum TaxID=2965071 RepID=A0AAE3MYP6_9HYPH|nr:integrase arm-type DNA-binding domain-containing protein [Ectorhizobium quercum]MCX8997668.1 integrase arm-type DNA-binding domain-containing protein [Ectorhizobium quercum]
MKRLSQTGMYAVGGVPGLHLQVLPGGGKTWLLRVTVGTTADGKQRRSEVGLGGYPAVTLQQARDKAREVREKIIQGIDPVAERKAARSALLASRATEITFEEAAQQYIAAKSPEWKNAKHAQQWNNTLETYAFPFIGKLQVRDIDTPHVLEVLEPIWKVKTETASRVRGRLEAVLDWATVRKYRSGTNPARWKGYLDTMLPEPTKVAKNGNHAALPFAEVGKFMKRLRKMEGNGARALEFTILTAARSGEVRGATWDEIDLEAKEWTIPAERMKMGKEHRVPLTGEAVTLLKALPRLEDSNLVFFAPRGGELSDMTLAAVIFREMLESIKAEGEHEGRRYVTNERVYRVLGLDRRNRAGAITHRVRSVMERLGWEPSAGPVRLSGGKQRVYFWNGDGEPPEVAPDPF